MCWILSSAEGEAGPGIRHPKSLNAIPHRCVCVICSAAAALCGPLTTVKAGVRLRAWYGLAREAPLGAAYS